ncbi:dephospho-CoA kinase [Marinospirillum perlucidum]|uniref:dephospho-CoA kinase n=1 Tax=Marinospirillum perlucidum TaxID=1982602 RepID=UPI000DF4C377|nr:dephospho-CoA kinase [Marinospirillum perlucidum]
MSDSAKKKLVIGLTGGIGSGKTAATDLFQMHGIAVIDADVLAREALAIDSPLLVDVFNQFGQELQNPEGGLNRAALRERVFNNPGDKKWLEELIHPWVRQKVEAALTTAPSEYSILSSPLLLETGQDQLVDRILVIDIPEALQLERTCDRDGNTPELVRKIMAQQISRDKRLEAATDVIDNSQGFNELQKQVDYWHSYYLQLARSQA